MKRRYWPCVIACLMTCNSSAPGQLIYQTAPSEASTWAMLDEGSGIQSANVAVNFGHRGTGKVSMHDFSAVGGALITTGVPIAPGSYSLGGPDSLLIGESFPYGMSHPPSSDGITAGIMGPFSAPSADPTSAVLTFTLDSGEFQAGDLLVVSNLSRQNLVTGGLVLGPMFDAPLSGDPFIPFRNGGLHTSIGVWGDDDQGSPIYVPGPDPGVESNHMYHSGGEIFRFNQNVSSFSVRLLLGEYGIDGETGDGITPLSLQFTPFSFTVASPVPEPSGLLIASSCLGVMALLRRRN